MSLIIGMISQKGGVGKSTLARLIAREYAAAGWNVKIADLDVSQGTSFNWQARRLRASVNPPIAVERFGSAEAALRVAPAYDLMILDGPPHSTSGTLRIADASDLVVLPTGLSVDDLEPSVLLAHELVKAKIQQNRIAFALCRVGDSDAELDEARRYIRNAGYHVLDAMLPEKTGFRRASDEGLALTETRFGTLNRRADQMAQAVVNRIAEIKKQEAA
jgi:chromosome partitioning protein